MSDLPVGEAGSPGLASFHDPFLNAQQHKPLAVGPLSSS